MENKKIIIFHTYTNHTKFIAESIKEKLNCDILELKSKKEYSSNYAEVVSEEQNNSSNNKIVKIQDIDADLSKYNTIILGSPVWWYTITPVVRTFLKENDMSGKIIIPFATNAGWLGRTFEEIETLCPNSKVINKMNIVFTEDYTVNDLFTSHDEIDKWIDSI